MTAIKSYSVKNSYSNLFIIGGIVMLCLGVTVGILTGRFTQIGLGILFIVMGSMQHNREIIKFYDEYLEMKLAPLSPVLLMKYNELERLEHISKKKYFIYGIVNGKQKRVRLPVEMISNVEQPNLIQDLKNRVPVINESM